MSDFAINDTVTANDLVHQISELSEGDHLWCDSLVVRGNIDLSDESIRISRCKIDFRTTRFLNRANFSSTEFTGEVNFTGAVFHENADFSHSTFTKVATFGEVTFNEDVNFDSTFFGTKVDFNKALFYKNVRFDSSSFSNILDLKDIQFFNRITFGHCWFNANVRIEHCSFNGLIDFSSSTFEQSLNISNSVFSDSAIFDAIILPPSITLSKDTFNCVTTFRKTQFRGEMNLIATKFNHVSFDSAVFDKVIRIKDIGISGDLSLFQTTFKPEVDFSQIQFNDSSKICLDCVETNTLKFDYGSIAGKVKVNYPSNGKGIIKTFYWMESELRGKGLFEQMDNCYFERRTLERQIKWENREYAAYFWQLFQLWIWGYGVKPLNTVLSSCLVLVAFSLAYYQLGAIQERKHNLENSQNDNRKKTERFRDALYFSVNTFTTVGYGDWVPTKEELSLRIGSKKIGIVPFRTLAMIEGLIGWLLLALFLVTLGRIMIR